MHTWLADGTRIGFPALRMRTALICFVASASKTGALISLPTSFAVPTPLTNVPPAPLPGPYPSALFALKLAGPARGDGAPLDADRMGDGPAPVFELMGSVLTRGRALALLIRAEDTLGRVLGSSGDASPATPCPERTSEPCAVTFDVDVDAEMPVVAVTVEA